MRFIIFILLVLTLVSCNPFAPGLDNSDKNTPLLSDRKTTDGVFQNIKYAYIMRDTSVYGQLINSDFTFIYRNYGSTVDETWGRYDEMLATNGLFLNAQRLNLIWNEIQTSSVDSTNTIAQIKRGFDLTVSFNPNDIIDIKGYATLQMGRSHATDPWTIVRWNDDSP
jgi:hypothetical protein